jgi:hypothetical protein
LFTRQCGVRGQAAHEPFGLLARTALAYVAIFLLVDDAPAVAHEDAAYALAHDSDLSSAWQAFNGACARRLRHHMPPALIHITHAGGDSLREIRGRTTVSVAQLVSDQVSWSWIWDQLYEINLPLSRDLQNRKAIVWLGHNARPFTEVRLRQSARECNATTDTLILTPHSHTTTQMFRVLPRSQSKQATRHLVSCIADQLSQVADDATMYARTSLAPSLPLAVCR